MTTYGELVERCKFILQDDGSDYDTLSRAVLAEVLRTIKEESQKGQCWDVSCLVPPGGSL